MRDHLELTDISYALVKVTKTYNLSIYTTLGHHWYITHGISNTAEIEMRSSVLNEHHDWQYFDNSNFTDCKTVR